MASLKLNVILNLINTFTRLVFPVVTFPYAARVLMPEGIGTVNFLDSIVSYIVLFTSLGIPLYAVREVARCRDDKAMRDQLTMEIIALSFCLCVIGYLGVWILGHFVPKIHQHLALFYVLSLAIVFSSIGVEWFYQAIEDFKYITIRGIIIRTLSAASLFIFVKTEADLLIYGIIIVGSTVGNNIINFIYLRHHISFDFGQWRKLNMRRHLKPSMQIFVLNLIVSLYIKLNVVMLGFMDDSVAVGFYTAGYKISFLTVTVITSLGTVMLPRTSNLIQNNRWEEFSAISSKAMRLVIAASLPCVVGLMLLAAPMMRIFGGVDFMGAVPVVVWTAPVVLLIAVSNVIGIQVLYPLGKENIVIWSTVCGAVINLALNIWLIPKYSYVGTAIATMIAELMVTLTQIVAGKGLIPIRLKAHNLLLYAAASLAMGLYLVWLTHTIASDAACLLAGILGGALIYGLILLWRKDSLLFEFLKFAHLAK